MEFGSFVLIIKDFLTWVVKMTFAIILISIAITAILPLLPSDPFRNDIQSISATFKEWADFINWFIPTDFIVSGALFAVACKAFFYVTRIVLNRLGVNFFSDFASSWDSSEWFDN